MNARAATLAVLGAGSWGTALAIQLARNGSAVSLWGHDPGEIEALLRDRENRQYLPGVALPAELTPSDDLAACLRAADEVLVVVPSHAFGQVCGRIVEIRPQLKSL
ncbi:MAG: NAD(P)-binding domain-containing protein, partial [Gammaproteobacteria bacterium]|nr:NAD(P)-binding domain-containing protein [Gammaproteobacteria bacterium]